MQIAKSLNYKMRCKGSLKTPPTRIKCIIFFILAEHQVCAFYTVGKNWEKIPMIQDPKILVKTQFELQFTEVKKKCDTFLSVFCPLWSLEEHFFFCMPARIGGLLIGYGIPKLVFFIICVASLLNNATFVVLPLASFVTHRIIFWVSFESSSLCTFVGHRIVAIDSLLDEQKGFHFLRKMMDALLTPPIQDEPPQRPRGAQKVIAWIKTLFRDPPGYF